MSWYPFSSSSEQADVAGQVAPRYRPSPTRHALSKVFNSKRSIGPRIGLRPAPGRYLDRPLQGVGSVYPDVNPEVTAQLERSLSSHHDPPGMVDTVQDAMMFQAVECASE